jgi:hypothetical protein
VAQRFDVGRIDRTKRTGAGGARMPATIARTGVQTYTRDDGKVVREYRPPAEVFSDASLATLGSVPVTIGHPGQVTPANWRNVAVGHVSDAPAARKQDNGAEWVEAQVVVADAAALARIDREDLSEVSMGYTADVIPQSGTAPDGQHYDAVQTNVRFNHLALLKAGQARAGAGARLRLDSKGDEMFEQFKQDDGAKRLVKVDGIDAEFGSETHVSLLERQTAAAVARADAADAAKAVAETASGEAKAKLDAANAEIAALKARDVDALVQDELAFRTRHLPALPAKYEFAGKSRDQVRNDAAGADNVAAAAKLPEGERAGYLTYAINAKLDAVSKPRVPTHTTPEVKADEKPKRRDPYGDAYKSTFPGAAQKDAK